MQEHRISTFAAYAFGVRCASAEYALGGQIRAAAYALDNHSGSGFNKRSG